MFLLLFFEEFLKRKVSLSIFPLPVVVQFLFPLWLCMVIWMSEKKKVIEVRTKAKTEPQIIFQENNPNFGYGIEN